jgi:bisphosphoglycerate-independent phosphoglycerate mutase (AlkP superfamily)
MSKDSQKKLALIILDGWVYTRIPGNAISFSQYPYLDKIWADSPRALLVVSGEAVGLPLASG